jgi:rhamnose transport system ATP-binding protein
MPLLAALNIRKSFAGVHALRGVSVEVEAGEVHALVGENGAGKSTLIRVMSGAETPDEGSLIVGDMHVPHMTPATAHALGVAVIYQQPALFPDLTVTENIMLALERGGPFARVNWRTRRRAAQELLARVAADLSPDLLADELTMPEQQIVEIAKALGANARVVIMDEPTASLSRREVDRLFEIIARLRQQAVGILYISHRLDEVMAIADRITVLRDGQTVATKLRSEVTAQTLVTLMVGREAAAVFPKAAVAPGQTLLELDALTGRGGEFSNITLTLRQGEILGLAGLVGAGRTALAEALFGLRPIARGTIRLNGRGIHVSSPADAVRIGIAYVPEDRRHSIIGELSVAANASLANLQAVSTGGLIDTRAEQRQAGDYIRQLQIKAPGAATPVERLSGGNQQKVALARWLATSPRVLILDEPTQGVDVGAKAEIHALMQRLVEQGLGILMISSDLPEVLAMSDRIAVMRSGALAGVLSREEATQERVLALALPSRAAAAAHS